VRARIVGGGRQASLARLLAENAATPPEEDGDLLDIPPTEPVPGTRLPSDVLTDLRADER